MVEVLTVNEVRAPVASAPRVSKSAEVIVPARVKVVSALELTVTAAALVTDTSVMVPAKVVDAAFLSLTVTAPPVCAARSAVMAESTVVTLVVSALPVTVIAPATLVVPEALVSAWVIDTVVPPVVAIVPPVVVNSEVW